jgi:large subunit ribosomal protein L9e
MKQLVKSEKAKIPAGVKIVTSKRVVTVTGPRGSLTRAFKHLLVDIKVSEDGQFFTVETWFPNRKMACCVKTVVSLIGNMIAGVTNGFRYKMRLVYAHFPINLIIDENRSDHIEIKNFIGQRQVRRLKLHPGVTISKSSGVKDEFILEGNDVTLVSQSAALIQQSCQARHKDVRKFLDGVYVSERGEIQVEE